MRKIILFNLITLDGFFEGPGADISWHNVDDEFNEFALEQLRSAGGLVFGRVTYELMASYWPSAVDAAEVARLMNSMPKYVFSRTLETAHWSNTTLLTGDAAAEIQKLKQQAGKDLYIFGSAEFASGLVQKGLVDEFRILVNPVVINAGTPLFKGLPERLRLKLLRTRAFVNGNVLLVYAPDALDS
jgi:dihydrofolate reductase